MKKYYYFPIRTVILTTLVKYVNQADEVWHAGDIGDLLVTDTLKKLKPLRAVLRK
jgi:hypothetical protein